MDYQYQPLASEHHVRILVLTPAEQADARLECSLIQIDLKDHPGSYKAISYTWGSQSRDQDLHCEGATIKITSNLSSALRRFRSRFQAQILWIDAVCINQDDVKETSVHIPLMKAIYRAAGKVLIWLGDGEEQRLRDIDALRVAANLFKPGLNGPNPSTASGMINQEPHFLPEFKGSKHDMQLFFELPWFSRRWAVQELVVNNNPVFYYGQSKIPWTTIHLVISASPAHFWRDDSGLRIRERLRKFGDLWQSWCYSAQSSTKRDFFSLMTSFRDLECEMDKDIIYSIAGIADDVDVATATTAMSADYVYKLPLIIPDYSATDYEVFRDFALAMMDTRYAFRTLSFAAVYQPACKEDKSLSSWIPDFRHAPQRAILASKSSWGLPKIEVLGNNGTELKVRITTQAWKREKCGEKTKPGQELLTHKPLPPIPSLPPVQRGIAHVKEIFTFPETVGKHNAISFYSALRDWLGKFVNPGRIKRIMSILESAETAFDNTSRSRSSHFQDFKDWYDNGILSDDFFLSSSYELFCHWQTILSTRKFYVSAPVARFGERDIFVFGAGPSDLQVDDIVVRPLLDGNISSFFRPTENGHEVLGDGVVMYGYEGSTSGVKYWWGGNYVTEDVEVELDLI
ncbi:unnamed protein product [Periconia digitata]|uniref:Heterokaryon incompatibility domain-containing protein n=1 Tax=Periconia digitata TaxID=1303443 RepID=A0A9W4UPV4_9PLEO|nr:unnamed protein product [Periconia digitata]